MGNSYQDPSLARAIILPLWQLQASSILFGSFQCLTSRTGNCFLNGKEIIPPHSHQVVDEVGTKKDHSASRGKMAANQGTAEIQN